MNIKIIKSKFLDLIEGRLSENETKELLEIIEQNPELKQSFKDYNNLILLENKLKTENFELSPNFAVKVMQKLEKPSSNFIAEIFMSLKTYKFVALTASLAVAVLVVNNSLKNYQTNSILIKEEVKEVIRKNDSALSGSSKLHADIKIDLKPAETVTAKENVDKSKELIGDVKINQAPVDLTAVKKQLPVESEISHKGETGIAIEEQKMDIAEPDSRTLPKKVILQEQLVAPAPINREQYGQWQENSRQLVSKEPLSTFSIDVDTGSYTNFRRFIRLGQLPPSDSVRIEEFLNYFTYNYPKQYSEPFALHYEIAPSPLEQDRYLLKLGLKTKDLQEKIKPWNLVFLIDVSGSMLSEDKLPLLKQSLKLLAGKMTVNDKISIVTYAGSAGTILENAGIGDQEKIIAAIDNLNSGGSTNGSGGIIEAYRIAEKLKIKDGENRVVLGTDGDFNVGLTNHNELIKLIEDYRIKGITLTTLGFGTGNFNEAMMEQLANKGNGNYFYIDSFKEARKIFEQDLLSTIETVAKDVKIQVEFNPALVSSYRLIGYDNRKLNNEDFNNDKIDAGEIGAGHTVTAIYELALTGSDFAKSFETELRYEANKKPTSSTTEAKELGFLKLRYKEPSSDSSKLLSFALDKNQLKTLEQSSSDFKFAAAVVYTANLLKNSQYSGKYNYSEIIKLAQANLGNDSEAYRREFLDLLNSVNAIKR